MNIRNKKDTTTTKSSNSLPAGEEIKKQKTLPKTVSEIQNGGLYIQRVRCGKSNCKCVRGETHTAFYFFTRRNGKLIKFYVRKSEVEAFSKMVNQVSTERAKRRESDQAARTLLKRLRESSREYEQLRQLQKQNYNNE
jgi:hypothetical protein